MPSERSVHAVQQGPMEFAIGDGDHALKLSETRTCPVWAMLETGTPIGSHRRVVAG